MSRSANASPTRVQLRTRSRSTVFLIEAQHPDGDQRINTGIRNIDHDVGDGPVTWTGAGLVVGMDLPEETSAIEVTDFSLSLNGVDPRFRAIAETKVRGNRLRIWLAFLDAKSRVIGLDLLEDAIQRRVGLSETDEGEATVTLYANGNFAFLAINYIPRWTATHQRAFLNGLGIDPDSDTGFDDQHNITQDNPAWYRP